MNVRNLIFCVALAPLMGCGGGVVSGDINLPPGSWAGNGGLPPEHHAVQVVPGEAEPVINVVESGREPTALALLNGRVIAGDAEGLWTAKSDDTLEFTRADVRDDVTVPATVSAVNKIGFRSGGGMFVITPEGLFHSHDDAFFRSPLTELVAPQRVRAINAVGLGTNEQVWIALDTHTEVFTSGKSAVLAITDLPAPAFAAGLTVGTGFLEIDGDLYIVQLDPARAALRLPDVGHVHSSVWSEGALVMATADRVIVATPEGEIDVTQFSLSGSASGTALAVRAISHGPGGLHVLIGEHLMRKSGKNWTHLATVPEATGTLTVDGWGQPWIGVESGMQRVRSGEAVTFAQIEPFLVQHCLMCHDTGVDGAPIINFLEYEVSKEWAPRILARVSDAQSPMPPRRIQILLPEDWALVKRWVEGGTLP